MERFQFTIGANWFVCYRDILHNNYKVVEASYDPDQPVPNTPSEAELHVYETRVVFSTNLKYTEEQFIDITRQIWRSCQAANRNGWEAAQAKMREALGIVGP